MKSKNIFIHIPKTGGTTLDCAITGTKWMTAKDPFYYRHIDNKTKRSNSGDIFNEANFLKYREYQIYTMLRHPIDKVVSEYFFVRDRKEFFGLLKKKPRNLKEYVLNKQSQNATVNFLIGGRWYPDKGATKSDLNRVIKMMDDLDVSVGIFEEYNKSLSFYEERLGVKFPKKINVKRVTLNRPKVSEISEEMKQLIIENNPLDMALYNYYNDAFNNLGIRAKSVDFSKDRYEYVMKYTERFNLMTLFDGNQTFMTRNASYFNDLNVWLHQHTAFENGRGYVSNWNKNVAREIDKLGDATDFTDLMEHMSTDEPLDATEQLTSLVNAKLKVSKHLSKAIMKFDIDKCTLEVVTKKKTSFFKKLFG